MRVYHGDEHTKRLLLFKKIWWLGLSEQTLVGFAHRQQILCFERVVRSVS